MVYFRSRDPAPARRYITRKTLRLSRDNLDENGGGNQSLKRRPLAEL
jgi:hypothetical protein